ALRVPRHRSQGAMRVERTAGASGGAHELRAGENSAATAKPEGKASSSMARYRLCPVPRPSRHAPCSSARCRLLESRRAGEPMKTFKHILVPTDFEKASAGALEIATSLARACDAKLTLLHVWEIPIYPYMDF